MDSSDNVSDESRKLKILQSPLEPEKRRIVTRLPRDVSLFSFLNLDGEGKEQEEREARVEEKEEEMDEEEEEEEGQADFGPVDT